MPGDTLIPKVLQQASSKTLPDVLMLDNPDVQQIAATGALAPLNDLGLNADGVIQGMVDATSYQGKLYGLAPVTNTIAMFYNKDMLAEAGVAAAEDLGRAEGRGQEADQARPLRHRLQRQRDVRGFVAVPAGRCGPTAATRPT